MVPFDSPPLVYYTTTPTSGHAHMNIIKINVAPFKQIELQLKCIEYHENAWYVIQWCQMSFNGVKLHSMVSNYIQWCDILLQFYEL